VTWAFQFDGGKIHAQWGKLSRKKRLRGVDGSGHPEEKKSAFRFKQESALGKGLAWNRL